MGNPPRISSWRSLLCSFFFSSSSFLPIVWCLSLKVCWKAYLALFRPLDLERKHNHGSTVRVKIIISLLRVVVVQNWNFDLSAGNLTGKLINLGFPWCITNSKRDSRRKRHRFHDKKPNWNAFWRNIWRDRHIKATRLRSERHWKLLLYLDFRSYFEAASPNWFNVFCKILLQSIFLARIINKSKSKSHQLILYLVHNL